MLKIILTNIFQTEKVGIKKIKLILNTMEFIENMVVKILIILR